MLTGMVYFRATRLENQPLFHLVAVRIGLSTFSGRFLKNINFPPPPSMKFFEYMKGKAIKFLCFNPRQFMKTYFT
jgi:hypothetical protein